MIDEFNKSDCNEGSTSIGSRQAAYLLVGKAGNDTLRGGGGRDTLTGGSGFDTYIYQAGDGSDTIDDSDAAGRITYGSATLSGGFRGVGKLIRAARMSVVTINLFIAGRATGQPSASTAR